jgi:hypothetical protein
VSTISKRDAAVLVASIRSAYVAGRAIAAHVGGGSDAAMAGFVGGLESVLSHFLLQHGCVEASAMLKRAMNDAPTEAEIAARNARATSFGRKAPGAAS